MKAKKIEHCPHCGREIEKSPTDFSNHFFECALFGFVEGQFSGSSKRQFMALSRSQQRLVIERIGF